MANSFLKKNLLTLLFLFILTLLIYGNSLNNAFLSDDIAEIVQNPKIGDLSNIFTRPFGFIRLLLYWLAFQVGGLNPFIFRAENIFFHAGSVLLIYILLNKLYSKRLAVFVAVLFAIHPAISEAVVWISGGMYAQYTFFFLLSFLLYIFARRPLSYLLSAFFYLLSLMSHPQMPLALFLVFPLWEFAYGNLRKNWPKAIPFLLIAAAYTFLSLGGISERETTLQSMHYQQRGMDNLFVLIPIAISSYFELIFFPKILTLYHSELAFGQIQFIIRFLITLIFFIGILISLKKNKTIFFWSLFFLLALSPTLTPFRLNWIVAERYLYLPIVGILVLIGLGLDKLSQYSKFKQITYILFIVAVLMLSGRTILRNIDWKNEDNLWIATGKTSPSSPNTHNNLGDVYGRRGNKEAALKEFQKAIELKPNYGDAYHNLANTYRELGDINKALENYQNALEFNPNLWQSYQNMAALYFEQKKYELSLENLQKAITVNPTNINLRLALGIVYLNMGNKTQAKEVFNLILSVDPNNQVAQQGLLETAK